MNFLDGNLVADDGGLYFDEGTARIRLSTAHQAALGEWVGRDVVLGVRPEAMGISGEGRFAGEGNTLDVQLGVIEPLGEKMDVYASTAKHPHIISRIDADSSLKPNQPLTFHLDMTKVHVFEPGEKGVNLCLGGATDA